MSAQMTGSPAAENSQLDVAATDVGEDEISLLDLAIVLAKHKKRVVGTAFGFALIAAAVSVALPNIYTGSTKVLPPQQSSSTAAAMLAQLGGLAGLAGGAAGIKTPSDLYIGMLRSRTVADNLIQRFDLNKYYEEDFQSVTRADLDTRTNITAGKDGIITIEVDDKHPKRAAEMANAYVDELFKLTKVLAVTDASQRRLFFERQFIQAKDNLTKAEIAAKRALDNGGLANIDVQGKALLETTARLRGQISVKEVQIGAMRSFAADQNPGLRMVQQELEALKNELARIEGSRKGIGSDFGDSTGFESLRLVRDVKYYETIYELMAKQYEMAKIDEAKDSAVVQVMDQAIEPDRKSKPKRALIVLLSLIAGGFIGILWAFAKEGVEMAKRNPEKSARLEAFGRYLAWRSR